jgi:hypothetical protein
VIAWNRDAKASSPLRTVLKGCPQGLRPNPRHSKPPPALPIPSFSKMGPNTRLYTLFLVQGESRPSTGPLSYGPLLGRVVGPRAAVTLSGLATTEGSDHQRDGNEERSDAARERGCPEDRSGKGQGQHFGCESRNLQNSLFKGLSTSGVARRIRRRRNRATFFGAPTSRGAAHNGKEHSNDDQSCPMWQHRHAQDRNSHERCKHFGTESRNAPVRCQPSPQ